MPAALIAILTLAWYPVGEIEDDQPTSEGAAWCRSESLKPEGTREESPSARELNQLTTR